MPSGSSLLCPVCCADEDFAGKVRLMEILNSVYDIPIEKSDYEKAAEQRKAISQNMEELPNSRALSRNWKSCTRLAWNRCAKKESQSLLPRWRESSGGIMGKKDIGEA